jgi:hypothetical protein
MAAGASRNQFAMGSRSTAPLLAANTLPVCRGRGDAAPHAKRLDRVRPPSELIESLAPDRPAHDAGKTSASGSSATYTTRCRSMSGMIAAGTPTMRRPALDFGGPSARQIGWRPGSGSRAPGPVLRHRPTLRQTAIEGTAQRTARIPRLIGYRHSPIVSGNRPRVHQQHDRNNAAAVPAQNPVRYPAGPAGC